MRRIFIIAIFIYSILQAFIVHAETIYASSCSYNDIQSAIKTANPGDTVFIPVGKCTNSETIFITKSITLQGADKDRTILQKTGGNYIIHIKGAGNVSISSLTLNGNNESKGIYVTLNSNNFHFDYNKFTEFKKRAIEISGYSYGVIDRNEFIENSVTDIVIYGDNDDAWNRPIVLGGGEAVFIEDNYFMHNKVLKNSHSVASNRGARYVFRYNTIDELNPKLNTAPIDVHGNFYYGRGSVSAEIYNNVVNSAHSYRGIYFRGGTGVVYNNTFTGEFTFPIHLTNYRSWKNAGSDSNIPGRDCSVNIAGTIFYPNCCSYPCIDQINNLYFWGNTYNGRDAIVVVDNKGLNRVHIQKNRDYFNTYSAKPGYKPYTYPHPLTNP